MRERVDAKATTRTVLVVDDDLDTRDLLGRALTADGYGVRLAANGWEGLLAMRDEPRPDLVLLDLMMPGMDGGMFLQSLAGVSGCAAMPCVVMTALDGQDALEDVRAYGVERVLRKGEGLLPQVRGAVRHYLDDPPASPADRSSTG